jgi:hypothetical protein
VLAALLAEPRPAAVTKMTRLGLFLVFLLTAGGTAFIMYLIYYTGENSSIMGVQGRYFLPFGPLLFLAAAQWLPLGDRLARFFRILAVGLALLTLALYAFGLGATYYTNCGSSIYTGENCVQPIYKNLDKSGAPEIALKPAVSVVQTFKNVCGPMDAVSVLIKNVPENAQGAVRFELLDSNNRVMASALFPAAETGQLKYMEMPVSPPAGEKTKQYQLRISQETTPPAKPVTLATSHSQEIYDGALTVNGVKQDADLIFHYDCLNPYRNLFPWNK